ncbi:MAG: hypothetical protein P1U46_01820 [Patescibacteria group bacterium]|nr:hypothetical protein [Patescibacteria group bacterium]
MPIESINISNDSDLLNIIIKYYHNYDCYNLDANKEKIKTVLWKYSLK